MPYIPRPSNQAPINAIPNIVKKKYTFRVFGVIATLMLTSSFLSLFGVFAYRMYILKQLGTAKEELVKMSGGDATSSINDIERFHEKIYNAQRLIDNHLAPSKLFSAIENETKQTIQITSLSYTYDPGFQARLEMKAGTHDYMSVALQDIQLNLGKMFTTYGVEDISSEAPTKGEAQNTDLSGTKKVSFGVSGEIDKKTFLYTGNDEMLMQNATSSNVSGLVYPPQDLVTHATSSNMATEQ